MSQFLRHRILEQVEGKGSGHAGVYPTDGLIARYQFEDNLEDSYNDYDLTTLLTDPSYGNGIINRCGSYNRTKRQYTNELTDIFHSNEFSVSLWVKTDTSTVNDGGGWVSFTENPVSSTPSISANKVVWSFDFNANNISFNVCLVNTGCESVTTPFNYCDNNWHHYVLTLDGSISAPIKLYIDNQDPCVGTCNRMIDANTSFVIGGRNDTLDTRFIGLIDQVYVYNRALTASDVSSLYNNNIGV